MKRELEKKFIVGDEVQFIASLAKQGIYFGEPIKQVDFIYLRKGKCFSDLNHGEPVLRIRETANDLTTTLKIYKDGVKDRTEVECGIDDKASFDEYLRCLQFEKVVIVDKMRRKAKFFGVNILFDEVNDLGCFVEIEVITDDNNVTQGIKILNETVTQLGFSNDDIVDIPYDEMIYKKNL